jgi:hypothetical protein
MLETPLRTDLQGLMSTTNSQSFTRTNARFIASKVAADLRQMRLFYAKPSESSIQEYIEEFVELLVGGYLQTVEYGFKRDADWVISARYEVRSDGTVADTGTGDLYARADIEGAFFYTYLTYTAAWSLLTSSARDAFKQSLPFQRGSAAEPGHVNGYWETGKSYADGGVGAVRSVWRPL